MVRKMKLLIAFGALLFLAGAAIVLSGGNESEFADTENQVRYDLGGIK